MNKSLRTGLGVLLVLIGLIWALQGLGVLKSSSPMTDETLWVVIGSIVAIIGFLLVAGAARSGRP